MTDATTSDLLAAVARYFDLMFDNDTTHFDGVFAPTAQLHGLRDGNLKLLPAADYRQILETTPSPKTKHAQRRQEVLMLDLASPTQAMVKVRVRIDTRQYVDYLSYHRIDGAWRITAKSFHVEQEFQPGST